MVFFHQQNSWSLGMLRVMNPLTFGLIVSEEGLEEDAVTPKRMSHIYIDGPNRVEQERIQYVLSSQKISYSLLRDGRVGCSVGDMFTVIRVLEEHGWTIQDHVPFFVWQVISQAQARPGLTMEHMREKIGASFWDKLHPYQRVGVRFAAERGICYNADEMGTGKTIQALMSCKYFEEQWPVIIVCPSSLKYTWRDEIRRWLEIPLEDIYVVQSTKHLMKVKPHRFLILSYGLLARGSVLTELTSRQYKICVMDECHYVKNRKCKTSQAAYKLIQKASVRFLLSGTPFNYPSEMYQQIKLLNPTIYPWFFDEKNPQLEEPGKYFFAQRYCKPRCVQVRNRPQWVYKGYERHTELNAVLNTFMIRRRKHEILTQLPAKNRICITLSPLTKKQEKELSTLLKIEKKPTVTVQSSSDTYSQAFHLTSKYKIPYVLEFIKDHLLSDLMTEQPDMKALIFMHHDIMREALEKCLQECHYSYFLINGETTPAKRNEYTRDFQSNSKYRIGLLSITAAGVGLTLTAASTVVFTEILYGPDQHLQAEDRSHRLGQKNTVNIFYLLEPGTTDDMNFGMIRKKERESSTMLDGKANFLSYHRVNMDTSTQSLSEHISHPTEKRPRHIPESEPVQFNESGGIVLKRHKRTVPAVMRWNDETDPVTNLAP